MGIYRCTYLAADGFDFSKTLPDQIRIGYLLKLPYRLRLGKLYRHIFSFRSYPYELVLFNKHHIPEGTTHEQVWQILSSKDKKMNYNDLWTQALIIARKPDIAPSSIEKIRNWVPANGSTPRGKLGGKLGKLG